MNRRRFLRTATVGAAGLLILKDSRSARAYQANEKLDIALVGCGGRGEWFVDTVPQAQNLVALCDVHEQRAAKSFAKLPNVPRYHDFRKMLEDRDRHIDAVIIAAPDHIHAPCALMALKMGKHVFCEKPLTRDIHEARLVRQTAARSKGATQMGNQGTSSEPFRRAVELVQAGVIGDVTEVHAWNEGGGAGKRGLPTGTQPVPDYLQWDLWLGPAPARPYHPDWLQWHAWREFGSGQLGNWASHTMNLLFMSLKLDSLWDDRPALRPEQRTIRVDAECESLNRESFPRWEILTYSFPARGALPPVKVHWYNGHDVPRGRQQIEELIGRRLDWGDAGEKKWNDYAGCVLVGTKGMIHSTGHNMSFTLLPESRYRDFEGPPKTLPRTSSHEQEWYDACRGGRPTMARFEYGGRLAEFVLLGNIATQFPPRIEFDPVGPKVLSPAGAGAALRHEYRRGWEL